MESPRQKRRRLFGKLKLPIYLEALNKLLNRPVIADDLLSVAESDAFLRLCNHPLEPIQHRVRVL